MTEKEQNGIFDSWIAKYRALLFKVVRAYAFTAMDRDDLFQEIAIQVWRSVPSFRHESSEVTWLYRIALNVSIKWSGKERRHVTGRESVDHVHHRMLEDVPQMDDRLAWMYEEISRLDKIDRSISLLMLEGFSYKEMSAIIGMTESNVGVRINRIKKHLIERSKNITGYGI
ncbi:MAG TPA: RNA polymerase sigma factor [Cyclobacteriaceae bacterium]|nr:RNA polymerase sigma factor [Cyclobacteriaceae bacterium]